MKLLTLLTLAICLFTGCGSDVVTSSTTSLPEPVVTEQESQPEPTPEATVNKINVVATTTMLYDLISVIGGEAVDSYGLCGYGVDPHLYKATAGDIKTMTEADVVVYNGFHLEGQLGDVFASLENIICIEDGISEDLVLYENDMPDPHIWFDVKIWMEAAEYVADMLCEFNPENEEIYKSNLAAYMVELDKLETYIHNRVDEVTRDKRVLITAHDAFNYFGDTYQFEVIGLQGISTDSESSTADISDLADLIYTRQIKAIFTESSVSTKNIEALQAAVIAKGFDVIVGMELYSDSLGDPSSGHDNYIYTVKANVDVIIDALR